MEQPAQIFQVLAADAAELFGPAMPRGLAIGRAIQGRGYVLLLNGSCLAPGALVRLGGWSHVQTHSGGFVRAARPFMCWPSELRAA